MTKIRSTDARANVVILYNYYKSWTPQERADADVLTASMVNVLRDVGHVVETFEFWQYVRPAIPKYKPS